MRLSYLIIIIIIIILQILCSFDIIPVWGLLLSVIPVLITAYERGFGLHQLQLIISLMIGALLIVFIAPIVLNTTINATIPTNMTTTTITSGRNTTEETIISPITATTNIFSNPVTSIFTVLLPLILLVISMFHFIDSFIEDYYDDTGRVHIGERTFRNYSYDYVTEQAKFEKDILDMDKIFRNET